MLNFPPFVWELRLWIVTRHLLKKKAFWCSAQNQQNSRYVKGGWAREVTAWSSSQVRKPGRPKLNPQPFSRIKRKKPNVPKNRQRTIPKKKRQKVDKSQLPLHPFSKNLILNLHIFAQEYSRKKSLNFPPLFFGKFSQKGGEVESNTTDGPSSLTTTFCALYIYSQ